MLWLSVAGCVLCLWTPVRRSRLAFLYGVAVCARTRVCQKWAQKNEFTKSVYLRLPSILNLPLLSSYNGTHLTTTGGDSHSHARPHGMHDSFPRLPRVHVYKEKRPPLPVRVVYKRGKLRFSKCASDWRQKRWSPRRCLGARSRRPERAPAFDVPPSPRRGPLAGRDESADNTPPRPRPTLCKCSGCFKLHPLN